MAGVGVKVLGVRVRVQIGGRNKMAGRKRSGGGGGALGDEICARNFKAYSGSRSLLP